MYVQLSAAGTNQHVLSLHDISYFSL